MIGKNIKYYRLLRNMSLQDLADRVGLNKMTISNYENGKRELKYDVCQKIADALDITLAMLISKYGNNLSIQHGPFRKKTRLSNDKVKLVYGQEERFFGRLFDVVSFLGDASLAPAPSIVPVKVTNTEDAGQHLRQLLGLPASGPIGNITDILENKGYIVCPIDVLKDDFSGNSGYVNGRPYIAINVHMPAERQRFTLIHELAHLVFDFSEDQNEERMVDEIAGAFLLPREDIIRELGPKRRDIRGDLRIIQQEYNISMSSIVMRAHQAGIINQQTYTLTMKWMSANVLRKDERSGLTPEKTHLLEQLTLRAVAEEEIGISKAAEILELPLLETRRLCFGGA